MDIIDRAKGCLVGLACGDAVGTTVEFRPRGTFEPVTQMTGGGPFSLKKGQWTDDTSMALCLAQSLLDKNGFDPLDQMNKYCSWYQQGYMSSNGKCFDIGGTVHGSLNRFIDDQEPFNGSIDEYTAGNGSLMRLAPIPIYYCSNPDKAIHYAGESSRTTHGATECIDSCKLFTAQTINALEGKAKDEIIKASSYQPCIEKVAEISKGNYLNFTYEELTGSGYVIESLESALWCFYNSNNFEDAILLAVNIGNDADTTAAICGQVAGAYYGYECIPEDWRKSITMSDEISKIAQRLYVAGNGR